jgi:hypothetical protein
MSENETKTMTPDQKAAHYFLSELRTRIATELLPYQNGVEQAALDSLVTLFPALRKTLAENPGCLEFSEVVIPAINEHLRPLTAKWHSLSVQGVLLSRDGGDAFRADLLQVQAKMRELAKKLHEMAYGKTQNPPNWGGAKPKVLSERLLAPLRCGIPMDEQAAGGVESIQAKAINQAEWKAILKRRTGQEPADKDVAAPEDAVGLAFSGGGIRSATFCLGVAQVLAEKDLMKDVDYLSTVSGGGYTGSFITRQVGEIGDWTDVAAPRGPDPKAVQGVRQQASYLRTSGLMDVWEKFVTFTAGTLLNWTVPLVLLILVALLFLQMQRTVASKMLPMLGTVFGSAIVVWVLLFKLYKKGSAPGWQKLRPDRFAFLLSLLVAGLLSLVSEWTGQALGFLGHCLGVFMKGVIGYGDKHRWYILAVLMIGALIYYAGLSSKRKIAQYFRRFFIAVTLFVAVLGLAILIHGCLNELFFKAGQKRWISFHDFWRDIRSSPWFIRVSTGGISLGALAAFVLSVRQYWPDQANLMVKRVMGWIALAVAGLLLPFLAGVCFLLLVLVGHFENFHLCGWNGADVLWLLAVLIALIALFVLDINLTGPQRIYRAGLSQTFVELTPTGQDFPLSEINPKGTAPLHLINAALNLPNCKKPQLRERRSDFFLFSKHFTGSPALGYVASRDWQLNGQPMDLATAMSISGAAFSANMGLATVPAMRALLAFINIRLAYWLRRPDIPGKYGLPPWPHPGFVCLLREMFALGMKAEKEAWVNVSDGGHLENLATYELLRRRCKFIICVDGECDPNFTFHGLMTLVRHAQIDLGVKIEPNLSELRPNAASGLSRSHFHLCQIEYPKLSGESTGSTGLLLYLKLSVTGNESELIQRYRKLKAEFPHQSTMDQFFDEEQFEAYRQLGVHVAEGLFGEALMSGQTKPNSMTDWFRVLAKNLL